MLRFPFDGYKQALTALSLLFAVFPAWLISTSSFSGRKFYDIVLYLPLAIPSYIMAFTYSDILSYTGPMQTFLRNNYPQISNFFNKDYLQIEVLGIIMALSLFPYIYTVSRVSFSLLGSNYINVAKNLGLSSFQTFYKIILPLSRQGISRYGTRHLAALGITERFDRCICVVVSEETGTLSLASQGRLERPITSSRLLDLLKELIDSSTVSYTHLTLPKILLV